MLSSIEIIAWFIVLLGLVKLLVFFINPKSWSKVVSGIYSKPGVTSFVALVLAIVVFYFLIAELSIVHIFAVLAFCWLLMIIGFAPYSKEFVPAFRKILADRNIIKKSWLSIVIWLILAVYVLEVLIL